MLNLFILVIIQQFDQYYLSEDNVLAKFERELYIFKNAWTAFTQANKCIKIKDNKLVAFFKSMEDTPLGMTNVDMDDEGEIHKNIVQMDIRADEEGYVYFNELLYKVMKKEYGIKHIRNKKLADYEASTFIKINKIQEKMSKYLINEEKKAIAVNPFLAIMYYNISFKTWLNLSRKKIEADAQKDNVVGSENSNDDFSESEPESDGRVEASEYSYQTFVEESVLSSSADLSEQSKEDSNYDSGIDTITEKEAEEYDKDAPDASFDNTKGKRLFDEDEEKEDFMETRNFQIMETDEKKEEDFHSDGDRNKESRESKTRYFDEQLKSREDNNRSFEKRKSSCPESLPYPSTAARREREKGLNIIEENNNEQTFSIDAKEI